jgi:hypothetical protein
VGGYAFEIGDAASGRILSKIPPGFSHDVVSVCRKDSTEIDDEDRRRIVEVRALGVTAYMYVDDMNLASVGLSIDKMNLHAWIQVFSTSSACVLCNSDLSLRVVAPGDSVCVLPLCGGDSWHGHDDRDGHAHQGGGAWHR